MARIKVSLAAGIVVAVVAMHAVLLPALYYGLSLVVSRSHANLFTQHVRTLSRNLTDELELGALQQSPLRLRDALDSAIINGDGVYAELIDNDQVIDSELNVKNIRW